MRTPLSLLLLDIDTESGADVTPAGLIADADRALYRAKQLGRNRVAMDGH